MPVHRHKCGFTADVVQREVLETAPWIQIMLMTVPFSDRVCVAGSAGTWLAEFSIHKSRPDWDPQDIDVFMMVDRAEYDLLCETFGDTLAHTLSLSGSAWKTSAHRPYPHILNILYSVDWHGSVVTCPAFSLIHMPTLHRHCDVLARFDIDVCKVAVHKFAGFLGIAMNAVVRQHILHRHMHCVIRKNPSSQGFHYPMQKTLSRISKYVKRGYCFKALQFGPSDSTLKVTDFVGMELARV
jgi:hypothetical protein